MNTAVNLDDTRPAHSQFGGSVATRILCCPGSVRAVEKVPPHLRKPPSVHALRGSALHSTLGLLIERERRLDRLAGETIDGYTLTADDIENALRPALAHAAALIYQPDAEYYLEQRIVFPTVPNAYGTADLLVRVGTTVHITDYKFGVGVPVRVLAPDGAEDVLNAQVMFYAAAARYSLPEFFAGVENIVLTIVQPQSIELDAEPVSSVTVTHTELDEFVTLYRAACAEALNAAPRLQRGPHCRFCAAKPICPEHTKPLLDLAQFTMPTPATDDYFALLAAGLDLVDAVKDIGKALHDQAKRALENGDQVLGYALTSGRAMRSWHDENAVIPTLIGLGLSRDDVVDEILKSPKQVELRARARSLKIPNELIVSRPSGVSLVRAENARAPVLGRGELARSFSEALTAFQEGGTQ